MPFSSTLRALPWPLPAVLAWAGAWAAWSALRPVNAAVALAAGLVASVALALALSDGPRRRLIAAAGYPLSSLALGVGAALPAWAWLLAALPLAAAYPLRAWRDAPFFPTPADALQGLDAVVQPAPHRVLDAGCGLGHGLRALRRAWPAAELHGIECSWLLAMAARLRCRAIDADARRGDMWAAAWAGHDLVYLFQRPESMQRAWAKACAELAPGAWLVSLEFAVPGQQPAARLQGPGRRDVWVYRTPSLRSIKSAAGR